MHIYNALSIWVITHKMKIVVDMSEKRKYQPDNPPAFQCITAGLIGIFCNWCSHKEYPTCPSGRPVHDLEGIPYDLNDKRLKISIFRRSELSGD